MATKKTLPVQRTTRSTVPQPSTAYDHLHALLHTVRCIAQYEDVLCEITHGAKRSGTLSPKLSRELDEILDKIPSHAYVSDLYAVRGVLVVEQASLKTRSRKSVKAVPSAKNPVTPKTRKPSLKSNLSSK